MIAATNKALRPGTAPVRSLHKPFVFKPTGNRLVARVANVTQDTFEAEVLQSEKPVVVDFWANWCGPCKLVAPLMDAIDKDFKGTIKVVKVEHDANPKLIEQYKVYGLPALILIKDGKLVEGSKREGAITKALMVEWLKKNGVTAPA